MICKKCGCRVNDDAAFCDKCGASMAEFGEKETPKPKGDTLILKNKKLVIAIAVVLAVLLAVLLVARNGAFIDEKTKYAIQATQAIQESLLAPDSIKVLDAYVAKYSDDEEKEDTQDKEENKEEDAEDEEEESKTIYWVYIYCTAQTRGGGISDDAYICYIHEDGTVSTIDEDRYIENLKDSFSTLYEYFGMTFEFDEQKYRQQFQDRFRQIMAEGTKIDVKKIMKAIENAE